MLTRRLLLAGTGAALLTSITGATASGIGAPVPLRFPRPTGPFPVGTTELHLIDHDRDDPYVPGRPRELMISVWYPARGLGAERAPYLPPLTAKLYGEGAAVALQQPVDAVDWVGARAHATTLAPVSRGRRPIVLFSPGFGVPRGLGSIMVAELASRGYVVVTVDHTFEVAGVEFPGGRLEVQTLPQGSYALLARNARVADVRFVLDALATLARGENPDAARRRLPDGLGDLLDLRRIGAFGHSAGGITSLDVMDVDQRVKAGINMDAALAYGYADPAQSPTVAHGTDRPFLLMGTGGPTSLTHLTEPSWNLFWEHSTGWKRDLNVPDGRHYTFVDHQALIPWFQRFFTVPPELVANTVGTVDAGRILRSLRTYIPAFFDQHLRDRPHDFVWSRALPETTYVT
jgi:dienelactone hydrolase